MQDFTIGGIAVIVLFGALVGYQYYEYGETTPIVPKELIIEGFSISPLGAWGLIAFSGLACALCFTRGGLFVSVPSALGALLFLLEYFASNWTSLSEGVRLLHHFVLILAAGCAVVVISRLTDAMDIHFDKAAHFVLWVVAVGIPLALGIATLNGWRL